MLDGKPNCMMKSSNSFLAAVFPDLSRVATGPCLRDKKFASVFEVPGLYFNVNLQSANSATQRCPAALSFAELS